MKIVEITKAEFDDEVLKAELPVLVDFWAPWCTPCRMEGSILEEIADDFAGKLRVVKINIDEEDGLAERYSILSIPTLMLFHNGKFVFKNSGFKSAKEIHEMLRGTVGECRSKESQGKEAWDNEEQEKDSWDREIRKMCSR